MKTSIKATMALAIALSLFGAGCEKEGSVDIGDCRERIYLESNNLDKYFHTYICSYGFCARVETDKGVCDRVYTYVNSDTK